jgi:hypothetical protein
LFRRGRREADRLRDELATLRRAREEARSDIAKAETAYASAALTLDELERSRVAARLDESRAADVSERREQARGRLRAGEQVRADAEADVSALDEAIAGLERELACAEAARTVGVYRDATRVAAVASADVAVSLGDLLDRLRALAAAREEVEACSERARLAAAGAGFAFDPVEVGVDEDRWLESSELEFVRAELARGPRRPGANRAVERERARRDGEAADAREVEWFARRLASGELAALAQAGAPLPIPGRLEKRVRERAATLAARRDGRVDVSHLYSVVGGAGSVRVVVPRSSDAA